MANIEFLKLKFNINHKLLGEVASGKHSESVWAGVEWEYFSETAHDGMIKDKEGNEIRYFTCKQGHGSFVKLRKISKGITFTEAVKTRYAGLMMMMMIYIYICKLLIE